MGSRTSAAVGSSRTPAKRCGHRSSSSHRCPYHCRATTDLHLGTGRSPSASGAHRCGPPIAPAGPATTAVRREAPGRGVVRSLGRWPPLQTISTRPHPVAPLDPRLAWVTAPTMPLHGAPKCRLWTATRGGRRRSARHCRVLDRGRSAARPPPANRRTAARCAPGMGARKATTVRVARWGRSVRCVGSTRRWEADSNGMRSALATHDEVLRSAVEGHDGWLFKHTGDGVCAAFSVCWGRGGGGGRCAGPVGFAGADWFYQATG